MIFPAFRRKAKPDPVHTRPSHLLAAPSPIEQLFIDACRALRPPELRGLRFQYVVGQYRLDFALPKDKIGIELDGFMSHSSTQSIAADRRRQRALEAKGWYIIRFGGTEIYSDPAECVHQAAELVRAYRRRK